MSKPKPNKAGKLPTLYSRNEDSSIQTWVIEVKDDKYRTHVGREGGKITTSEWTVCHGKNTGRKNSTTDAAQALKEAIAIFDKKKKREFYFESVDSVDQQSYTKPMLAHGFEDYMDDLVYPVAVECKLNGLRTLAKSSGLWSRKGELYVAMPHISAALASLFKRYPNLVLDGEAYNHSLRQQLNELVKIARTIDPKKLSPSAEIVELWIYDGYGFDNITEATPFHERRAALIKLVRELNQSCIKVLTYRTANSYDEVIKIYESFLADKEEGAIIRVLNAPYQHKRTSDLLKHKPLDDDEFEIVRVIEGEGNRTGTAGKFIMKMKDGRTFGAAFKGNMQQFRDIWANRADYIGKTVTIFYNGFTGKGIPNYARYDCNNSVDAKDK
jgi:ATP-dependent DNA ligase